MFRLIFSSLLIFIVSLTLKAQIIPDGGLEIWATGLNEPLYWRTNNIYPPPLDCRQVFGDYLNQYSGGLCAKGIVDSCLELHIQKPPILRSLEIQIQQRPPALHGYYRFYPIGGDKFYARAEVYKNQNLIGLGEFKSSAEVPQYLEFVADINYSTEDTPDVAILRFTTDSSDFDKKIHNGSYWYLDELTFGPLSDLDLDEDIFPSIFYLLQNYPNPFNPSTVISYQLPVSSEVMLKVFDVLGNEVATLVDELKPAGTYGVEFQSAVGNRQLASGIYFYQLKVFDPESGSGQVFVQTKKMILLR